MSQELEAIKSKYNLNSIRILYILLHNECTSHMKSFTIKSIQEEGINLYGAKDGLADMTIKYCMKSAIHDGLVREGIKSGKAKKYYLTALGIVFVQALYNDNNEGE